MAVTHQSLPDIRSVQQQERPQQKEIHSMSVSDYLVAFTTQSHSFCVDV